VPIVRDVAKSDHGRAEEARLTALLGYRILDTSPEQAFDDLVDIAAAICDTPVASIAFVDGERSWFKAKRGVELSELPREVAMSTEALSHDDVFVIPDATKASSKARLLISSSASVGGFSDANYPMISLNGSTLLVTVIRGSDTFAIASASGKTRKLLTPSVRNPARFCGPLWVDSTGRRSLAACGDGAEFAIQNGKVTRLHQPWQLPSYATPGAPLIAW